MTSRLAEEAEAPQPLLNPYVAALQAGLHSVTQNLQPGAAARGVLAMRGMPGWFELIEWCEQEYCDPLDQPQLPLSKLAHHTLAALEPILHQFEPFQNDSWRDFFLAEGEKRHLQMMLLIELGVFGAMGHVIMQAEDLWVGAWVVTNKFPYVRTSNIAQLLYGLGAISWQWLFDRQPAQPEDLTFVNHCKEFLSHYKIPYLGPVFGAAVIPRRREPAHAMLADAPPSPAASD